MKGHEWIIKEIKDSGLRGRGGAGTTNEIPFLFVYELFPF